MEPKHRQVLHQHKELMKRNLNMEVLKDALRESRLFSKKMFQDIYEEKNFDFIDLLCTRGPNAFDKFITILKKYKYEEEVMKLLQSLYMHCKSNDFVKCTLCDGKINSTELYFCHCNYMNICKTCLYEQYEKLREKTCLQCNKKIIK